MIDREIFYDRRDNYCRQCEFWKQVCLKGHKLTSPMGCPVKKFPPVNNAAYMADRPVEPSVYSSGGVCRTCVQPPDSVPKMSFKDVLVQFAQSMQTWLDEGMPLVDRDLHARRFNLCKKCELYTNYRCERCKCVAYAKAKLATEHCPINKW